MNEIINGTTTYIKELFKKYTITYVIKNINCILIIMVSICNYYWDFFSYIDFPNIPIWNNNIRIILHSTGWKVFILWEIFDKFIFKIIYMLRNSDEYHMNFLFIYKFIDCVVSLYYLVCTINIIMEYLNGFEVSIKIEIILVIIYIVYNQISKAYKKHCNAYNQMIKKYRYTGYCDNEFNPIMEGNSVYYKGKDYKIKKVDKEYKLQSTNSDEKLDSLIKLEDAASDKDGNLHIKK